MGRIDRDNAAIGAGELNHHISSVTRYQMTGKPVRYAAQKKLFSHVRADCALTCMASEDEGHRPGVIDHDHIGRRSILTVALKNPQNLRVIFFAIQINGKLIAYCGLA